MSLSATVKIIQDIMRKDAGVDGDAQRINQLSWMIFLKILDDHELEYEKFDITYHSSIPDRLRWHNWTEASKKLTNDELLDFINNDLFKDFKKMPLEKLPTHSLEAVISSVFNDAHNYMKSGGLIRQVIDKINESIHFENAKDRHLFGDIYEKVLKDLQSAGYAGEFYTPRAVTEFVVDMIDPKLGDNVLDPACGTGGFLTCSIEHIRNKYVKNSSEELVLQQSIFGIEKKPLPHLLCTTNLLLHGIRVPSRIRHDNALSKPLSGYKIEDQVEVIMTNPPFGGLEDDDIDANFTGIFRSKETADMFFLLIIRLLKDGGQSAVILPDGFLFGEGVKTRIKEKLLNECNLHTIIRLPKGVFNPYTDITTNILFFTKGVPTKEIWYYEHPYPLGYKSYSKTRPILIEEFEQEKIWWNKREENRHAWKVSIEDVRARGYNLDIRNPYSNAIIQWDLDNLLHEYSEISEDVAQSRNVLKQQLMLCLGNKGQTEQEKFFANFNIFMETPKSVQKLRELILQLAMQGKLEPQIPSEESVLTLYSRIQDIKEGGKKEGLARQSHLFLPIEQNKYSFQIPETWKWVRLADIAQIVGGGTPDTNYYEYFSDNGIPWLTPADLYQLKDKLVSRGKRDISELGLKKSSAKMLPKGSVLFSSRAPIGYVAIAANDLATNQGFKSCVPYIMEMNEFIYYFLTLAAKEIERNASGTTFKEVSGKVVQQVLFPLPPLVEQQRIVVKINQLMMLLDECVMRYNLFQEKRETLVDVFALLPLKDLEKSVLALTS